MKAYKLNRFLGELQLKDYFRSKKKLSINERIEYLQKIAHFYWKNHTGKLAEKKIEEELQEIASTIELLEVDVPLKEVVRDETTEEEEKPRLRVLHVATEVYSTGGHTRILNCWLDVDKDRLSYLVLTDQKGEIPSNMEFAGLCEEVCQLRGDYHQRTKSLIDYILQHNFDLVVYHIHPDDAVAAAAGYVPELPPIAFFDHADHVFSLGIGIADIWIDFRELGTITSLQRRGVPPRSAILPYPISVTNEDPDKEKAKQRLELDPESTVLVTMAGADKVKPYKDLNMLDTYTEILSHLDNVHYYMIGGKNAFPDETKITLGTNSITILDRVDDPSPYLNAADYFIDSFPASSGMSAFVAIAHSAFPIFNYKDISIHGVGVKGTFPDKLTNFMDHIQTREGYIQFVVNEIKSGKYRKELLNDYKQYLANTRGEKWYAHVKTIYNKGNGLEHDPSSKRVKEEEKIGQKDIDWAEFNAADDLDYMFFTAFRNLKSRPTLGEKRRLITYFAALKIKGMNLRNTLAFVKKILR